MFDTCLRAFLSRAKKYCLWPGAHQKHKHRRFRMQNKHRAFFVACTVRGLHQHVAAYDRCVLNFFFFYSDKKNIYIKQPFTVGGIMMF